MSESIKRELATAREQWQFWKEFANSTSRRFAKGEIARIVAVQELAERRVIELERAISRYEESNGKVIGGAADQGNTALGQAGRGFPSQTEHSSLACISNDLPRTLPK